METETVLVQGLLLSRMEPKIANRVFQRRRARELLIAAETSSRCLVFNRQEICLIQRIDLKIQRISFYTCCMGASAGSK